VTAPSDWTASPSALEISRPRPNPPPYLTPAGSESDVAAREAGTSCCTLAAESRNRFPRAAGIGDSPTVRIANIIKAGEERRMGRSPALALAAAGRLVLFSTAPPLPTA
jgi:hypothetical protein